MTILGGRAIRAVAFVGVLAGATAAAELLFPSKGTQPGGLDGGFPFDDIDTTCVRCHSQAAVVDPTGYYMPFDTWLGTMMSNSMRDPLFLAALTVAEQDKRNIGQWCIRCHSPVAYVNGDSLPGNGSALNSLDDEGVTCEVCHRSMIDTTDPNSPYEWNAQITFDPTDTKHGPYSNPSPFHATLQDPFTSTSMLCGQCHEVKNPLVNLIDSQGNDTGLPFPLDTTFEEWSNSAYNGATPTTCQDCHMNADAGTVRVARGGPTHDNPPLHQFVGGNAWGIAAVYSTLADGGGFLSGLFDGGYWALISDAGYPNAYLAAQSAAVANLAGAATVQASGPTGTVPAGTPFALTVVVGNLTGHKLPTGYADGRRVFQQISIVDATGTENVIIGAYDTSTATLATDPQLRVYEAVQGTFDGGADNHLVRHNTIIKDTRIPPTGFQATTDTVPVATTWFNAGDGGYVDFDQGQYTLTAPTTPGNATVKVRLFYQPTTREYVEFLSTTNQSDNRGTALEQAWNSTGQAAPILMVETSTSMTVGPPPPDAGQTDSGSPTPGPDASVTDGGTTRSSSGCGCHSGEGSGFLAIAAWLSFARNRRLRRG
jgi:hypothetical protein